MLWLVFYWLDGKLVGEGWYGGTEFSRLQNGSTIIGVGMGTPTLALEERRAAGSGDWHQLRWCCKGAEYLCRSNKIIQIDCTKIGTNT